MASLNTGRIPLLYIPNYRADLVFSMLMGEDAISWEEKTFIRE